MQWNTYFSRKEIEIINWTIERVGKAFWMYSLTAFFPHWLRFSALNQFLIKALQFWTWNIRLLNFFFCFEVFLHSLQGANPYQIEPRMLCSLHTWKIKHSELARMKLRNKIRDSGYWKGFWNFHRTRVLSCQFVHHHGIKLTNGIEPMHLTKLFS